MLKKLNNGLNLIIHVVVTFLVLGLLLTVAIQHNRLNVHDDMLNFMNEGERFTFQDGLALYLICDKENITTNTGYEIRDIYDEFGETSFRRWILDNSKVHKE